MHSKLKILTAYSYTILYYNLLLFSSYVQGFEGSFKGERGVLGIYLWTQHVSKVKHAFAKYLAAMFCLNIVSILSCWYNTQ